MNRRSFGLALSAGFAALLSACSGGGGSGGAMRIGTCSLGCTASGQGGQVICGVTDVFVNQEIRITFSNAVDLSTVNNDTFQVVELGTGMTPASEFTLDPANPRVLIYRPALTFDSAGNPSFGLTEDQTYTFRIPGTNLDSQGPYIENVSGQANATRLQCTLVASRGVFDANPGPPRARVLVDVQMFDARGNPTTIAENQEAQGAVNVSVGSDITMSFDDIMNPATLANPVTGTSDFISIRVDPDGNTTTPEDQVPLRGRYTVVIDQDALTTTVVFRPDNGLPSAGTDPRVKRRVVVTLPSGIRDLGGNQLVNAGQFVFTPEVIAFPDQTVTETFDTNGREDGQHTGSPWGVGGALLSRPVASTNPTEILGGGSGRLGDLTVPAGRTVTLDTDMEDFSDVVFTDPTIFNPANILEPVTFGVPDPVSGGRFQFARLRIAAGGTLRFVGQNPPRIFVRGDLVVQGLIDVSGISARAQNSRDCPGGLGGKGGPGGGRGGDGGDRPDGTPFLGLGTPSPEVCADPVPAFYGDLDGKPGTGIEVPDASMPTGMAGEGGGGLAWPQPTGLDPSLHFPMDPADAEGLQYEKVFLCVNRAPGGAGGGGAYAVNGKAGEAMLIDVSGLTPKPDPVTPPPPGLGGDATDVLAPPDVRSLDPESGLLRGGAGGGGGGAHVMLTRSNGEFLTDCTIPTPPDLDLRILEYRHHSSAGGGGGGGGVQIQAGRNVTLDGIINASGGNGGGSVVGADQFAQAGGGGSGGAILIQGQQVQIQNVPGRMNVSGGAGGLGVNGSRGGDASPGLIRIESFPPLLNFTSEKTKIFPTEAQLMAGFSVGSDAVLSIGTWAPPVFEQSALSGAQSCWIQPQGNFFELGFAEDGAELGWDMLLRVTGFANPQSYRGDNDISPGMTLEEALGNDLGTAPVIVRFQGARALGAIVDPCNVVLGGLTSPLASDSLTGWVKHPAELNGFVTAAGPQTPNIFRFLVIWDASRANFGAIEGIEELSINVQPD